MIRRIQSKTFEKIDDEKKANLLLSRIQRQMKKH